MDNIVIEGGGLKTLAAIGVLDRLKDVVFCNVAGTSMGSIIALLYCLGYTPEEMETIALKTDFNKIVGLRWTDYLKLPYSLVTHYGINDGSQLNKFIMSLITKKGFKANLSFEELFEKTRKTLIINGSCLESRETYYFTKDTTPKMPVYLAVRISACLPILFRPVKLDINQYTSGEAKQKDIRHFVDGGLINNFPIDYFDDCNKICMLHSDLIVSSEEAKQKSLGIRILLPNEVPDSKFYHGVDPIHSFMDFLNCIANTLDTVIQRKEIHDDEACKIIYIRTPNINSYKFNESAETIKNLIQLGRDSR
jgi:predicted acylesterase/phospholipase RssA